MRWRASARVMGTQHSTSVIMRLMPRASTARRARVAATTASTQDYLAAIYDLGGSGKPVIGARLAKHMSVSAPAVTEAMHRMARGGYGQGGPGKELTLTPEGREVPEGMGRRRKVVEAARGAGTTPAGGDGPTIALGLPAAAKIWVYRPTDA